MQRRTVVLPVPCQQEKDHTAGNREISVRCQRSNANKAKNQGPLLASCR